MDQFITPLNHLKFKAKKIMGEVIGKMSDCSVAYIEPQGGGPEPSHTHSHDHLFIVTEGVATVKMEKKIIKVNTDEAIIVPGLINHSIWNQTGKPLKMIGITIHPTE